MRYSKQKSIILNNVLERCDHPSCEDVYLSVKKIIPNISLGTVYRNLNILADNNQIKRIHMPIGSDRFDKTVNYHAHFHCVKCNSVIDINDLNLSALYDSLENDNHILILSHDIVFTGICDSCKRKEEL